MPDISKRTSTAFGTLLHLPVAVLRYGKMSCKDATVYLTFHALKHCKNGNLF